MLGMLSNTSSFVHVTFERPQSRTSHCDYAHHIVIMHTTVSRHKSEGTVFLLANTEAPIE